MLQLAFFVTLSAAPQQTIALPGFTISGVDASTAAALTDRFATELGRDGAFKVISQRDLAQLLGLERQRALAGCADDTGSCNAELAAALGADFVITGSLLQTGKRWTLTLRVLSASDGKVRFSDSARVDDIDAVQDWLDKMALVIRERMQPGAEPSAGGVTSASTQGPPSRWYRWGIAGVGAAALVSGIVLFALSKSDANALRAVMQGDTTDLAALRSSGETKEKAGLALGAVGLAVAAAGLAWALWPSDEAAPRVSLAVTPFGAAAVFGGAW